jgi:hypothetical protein
VPSGSARRAGPRRLTLLAAACVVAAGLTGCGGNDPAGGTPGPAAGTPGGAAAAPDTSSGQPAAAPDVTRYCQASAQLSDLGEKYPDPNTFAQQASPQLDQMVQAAPADIGSAVKLYVQDIRAAGQVPGATEPDPDQLTQADSTIEAFETKNCP